MSGYSPGKATTHWTVVDKELYVRIFASSIGHDAAFEHKQREDGALVLTLRNFTGQLVCQSEASFELGSILEKAYLGGAYVVHAILATSRAVSCVGRFMFQRAARAGSRGR